MFEILFKYFWVAAIFVSFINFAILKYRANKHIKQEPHLAEGYAKLLQHYLFWLNLPWIVMGIGIIFGGVPSIWHFLRLEDGNPYILAWYATPCIMLLLGTYWIFFENGAETLVKHRFLLNSELITNPFRVKLFWLISLAGGIFMLFMLWTEKFPGPPIFSM